MKKLFLWLDNVVSGFYEEKLNKDPEYIINKLQGDVNLCKGRIAELEDLCEKIRDDLLLRSEIDDDGTRIVNLSSSIWNKLFDVLEGGAK